MSVKGYVIKTLNAGGLGIVIALIPTSIIGTLLKPLAQDYPWIGTFVQFCTATQFLASALVGFLVGLFLGQNPIKNVSIAIVAFLSSGALAFTTYYTQDGNPVVVPTLKGLGDLVNAILMAGLAAFLFVKLGNVFRSLELICLPIIGVFLGCIGQVFVLPGVSLITTSLAELVEYLTTLNPVMMAVFIGAIFALIIVSPVSTVVVALAIQINPVNSGVANLGITGTMISLLIGSLFVNKPGISLTIGLGIVKMMVGNLFRYPILVLPLALTGAITGLSGYFLEIKGTSFSAGFGYSGLIGPIAAYDAFASAGQAGGAILRIILAYVIIPIASASLIHFIFVKVLRLYRLDIVRYEP
ncbi:PTS sugar transporter subunit IIC [Psittacicella hinzii]|uniref:Phosphotransferase system EIIC domain-containing protein n=1 Tax=Psittacicella hinzii TaxID=2028575 RepID=A0A3A1YCU1_9GAMM|nr:PTS sugar transporter subunit IIC [Psittacicella hinzii]RIY35186.1 hypothetical protein CKF58_06920 [Psittacicella hinzii]